jgi:hypothetical protein
MTGGSNGDAPIGRGVPPPPSPPRTVTAASRDPDYRNGNAGVDGDELPRLAASPPPPPPPAPVAAAAAAAAAPAEVAVGGDDNAMSLRSAGAWLTVGRMVHVQARTWPGMNRPGGLGHVEKVYYAAAAAADATPGGEAAGAVAAATPTHVDVNYLKSEATARDRGVPVRYVSDRIRLAAEIEAGDVGARCASSRRSRRDAVNSRRCAACGSFATDCGDCDWRREKIDAAAEAAALVVAGGGLPRGRTREGVGVRRPRAGTVSGFESTATAGDSDDYGDDPDDSHCDRWSEDDERGIDSEEEERRRVKSMNRHRKRNGQITRRRRRRMRRTLLRREREGDSIAMSGGDGDNETSEDEVPLAILQLRKERRRSLIAVRERERKLRDMNLMMNKRDDQLVKERGGGKTKTKIRSSRTRPNNTCALIGLLPIATVAKVTGEGGGIDANNATNRNSMTASRESGRAENHHLRQRHHLTDKSEEKNGKRNNDSCESDSTSTDDGMDTFADLRARATFSSTLSAPADVDVNVDDAEAPGDVFGSGTDDTSDDEGGDYLLTPVEELDEGESNSSLLTPREEHSVENEEDGMVESDDKDKCKFEVREMEWGYLPNFIEELCAKIRDERITRVQNKLNELRRRLQAAKKRSQSISQSLLTTTTSDEITDEFDKLSEERLVSCFDVSSFVCLVLYPKHHLLEISLITSMV